MFANPKSLILATALVVVWTIFVDQALKGWAVGLETPLELAGIRFSPFENPGVFGGYLADLDPWIVRIFFSVLFAFLAAGVALVLYLLRHRDTPLLKTGLIFYVAGVFGNVWDRMSTGAVVDYAQIHLPLLNEMAFNFADAVVFLGAVGIAIALFREGDALWRWKDQRKGYWIEPNFQRGFAFTLMAFGFAHFFAIAIYSFVFLKVYVAGPTGPIPSSRVVRDYLFGLAVIETAALALTFAGSVFLSHRMVGPVVAFGQFVDRRKKAEAAGAPAEKLRLRESDAFKSLLEGIADRIERRE